MTVPVKWSKKQLLRGANGETHARSNTPINGPDKKINVKKSGAQQNYQPRQNQGWNKQSMAWHTNAALSYFLGGVALIDYFFLKRQLSVPCRSKRARDRWVSNGLSSRCIARCSRKIKLPFLENHRPVSRVIALLYPILSCCQTGAHTQSKVAPSRKGRERPLNVGPSSFCGK